ncbi:MAG TPA: hypothetical protein VIV57_01670 [Anaeromyxobacter sp.]
MTGPGRWRAIAVAAAMAGALPAAAPAAPRMAAPAARADEGWRAEFEDICAKTQDAMALSAEELRSLVERSDALLPILERLPEPERKVFTKRLQACRNLYAFVLETKEKR